MDNFPIMFFLVLPIIIIELGFRIYGIVDILKEERQVKISKPFWLVVVGLVTFGWVFYFLLGREDI
ncbi:MAG: PLDc N-terminal domain-containing protein [Candidatus Izimaplasma sp.]|nr:PLDc N-terminal domain-containing protein [Candidatus Izimaplasma bacterium]